MLPLHVNTASLDELIDCFESTPGFGRASAARIYSAREQGGPFVSGADFCRRVAFVSFERLSSRFEVSFDESVGTDQKRAAASGHTGSAFTPALPSSEPLPALASASARAAASLPARGKVPRGDLLGEALKALDRMSLGTEGATQRSDAVGPDIVFVTFNVCRMSPRPGSMSSFESKLKVLERLVSDTPGLSLILLQELFGNAAGLIAKRLRAVTGDEGWSAVGCGSNPDCERVTHRHRRTAFNSCQAAVYNKKYLRCLGSVYVDGAAQVAPEDDETSFKRPPHVCVFECARTPHGKLLCLANVHISYKDPRQEIRLLAGLSRGMRNACARTFRRGTLPGFGASDATVLIAGDFNAPGQSHLFRELRESGFAELMRSDHAGGPELRYLQTATSAGGNVLDNIFMPRELRAKELLDAWVYQVAGFGRSLQESGAQSYGRLRAERSDHLPIVAKLRLGSVGVGDSFDESLAGAWRCRTDFSVILESG